MRLRGRALVGERDVDARLAARGVIACSRASAPPVSFMVGRPRRQIDHAHVAPEHAGAQAGAERLGAGLLGGETLGIGLDRVARGAPPWRARPAVKMRSRKRSPWRSITFSMRRTSTMSEPRPMIMRPPCASARGRGPSRRASNLTVSASPSNTASPIRKWPILSSTICGSAAIVSALAIIEPVAGMHFEPELLARAWRPCANALPFGLGLGVRALGQRVAPGAGMNLDHRRAAVSAAASICAGSRAR